MASCEVGMNAALEPGQEDCEAPPNCEGVEQVA